MAEQANRDQNHVTSMLFTGSDNGTYNAKGDELTGRLFVDFVGGGGTVSSVSVVTANGFAGSVANSTTTPAITLSTTITGLLKGDGTAISAAVGNTDYQLPITLTTTGTSGAATFNGTTLNIPQYQASGTYVTSVSGTSNRITSTGGTTPVIDISAAYVGQTSITTLGTIGTGTWHGTSISTTYTDAKVVSVSGTSGRITSTGGGTPVLDLDTTAVTPGSYTNADITVDAYGRVTLAANGSEVTPGGSDHNLQYNDNGSFGGIGGANYYDTDKQLLISFTNDNSQVNIQTNSGDSSSFAEINLRPGTWEGKVNTGLYAFYAPSATEAGILDFSDIASSNKTFTFPNASGTVALTSDIPSVTPAALTKTDDTNVTLTLGGTPSTALLEATSLTLGWTGQLSLARGGTGASLSDPGYDGVFVWDNTTNATRIAALSGLSYDTSTNTLTSAGGFNLTIEESGGGSVSNVDTIVFDGASVTDDTGGQVTVTIAGGTGTVTSVAASVPTGFTISGSPVTTSGTLAIAYDTGYQGYTSTEASKLSGIEAGADVTDATNVAAAGAVMTSGAQNIAGDKTFTDDIILDDATASTIAIFSASKEIVSASTATYPSLAELAYVKGVTSAIQTQLNAKAADNAVVKLTGNQTVADVKTFSSFPVTPSSAPTTDYQVANKKYVDDNAGGGGITWNNVTGTSQTAAVNNGYIANNAGLVTVTLPSTCAIGDVVRVGGAGAGGWLVAQNSGQTIHFLDMDTTTGTGGNLASTNQYDAVEMVCTATNTDWVVVSSIGNIEIDAS